MTEPALQTAPRPDDAAPLMGLFGRSLVGGTLMGLANLVPGISGGTMLLASGVYPRFITAISEVTTFRFKVPSLVVLCGVGGAAAVSILLFAGGVKELVVHHRWIMYSVFIGLTLGGVPVLWRVIGQRTPSVWGGAVVGFVGMLALALVQQAGAGTGAAAADSVPMMLLAGVVGASAMILPGVSGGYLLLVLGLYVPILAGIESFKDGLKAMEPAALVDPTLRVVIPVGIGVVVGVVAVSNVLRVLLVRYNKATLGVLLGLLLGAAVGLFPFQEGVRPEVGDLVKGRVMTEQTISELDAEDYPTRFFRPSAVQAAGAVGIILLGLAATLGIALIGEVDEPEETPE